MPEVSNDVSSVDSNVEVTDNLENNENEQTEQLEGQEEGQTIDKKEEKPKSSKKKLKIKVDGQEEDVEIDIDNEEELRKMAQMSRAAMKRMSEAAKSQKQAESFMQKLKTNPRAVLEDPNLGVDFRQIAEEYLYEQLQRESMTPEEIEYQEKMKRLEAFEKAERDKEEQAKQEQAQKAQQYWAEQYDKTITDALKGANLPKTTTTIKRMAQLISKNLDLGLDLEPSDLVEEVKKSYISEFKEIVGSSDAETLLAIFGDEIANKIRKHDISKLKIPNVNTVKTEETVTAPKSEKGYMTPDEYKEWLNKRISE